MKCVLPFICTCLIYFFVYKYIICNIPKYEICHEKKFLLFQIFGNFTGSGLHNLVIVEDGGGGATDGGDAKGFAYDNPGFMDESSEAKSKTNKLLIYNILNVATLSFLVFSTDFALISCKMC